jgi:hypothetical protein
MTNYAQIEQRTAFLHTEFGEELARRWFGDESVNALPRYKRGKHKGKIKGAVTWSKVLRGGWVRDGLYGYVENRVGHVFERKLHEIYFNFNGTHVGRVLRDLDKEQEMNQISDTVRIDIDNQIRKIDRYRSKLETTILSEKFDEYAEDFRRIISEYNEEIAALIEQLKKLQINKFNE